MTSTPSLIVALDFANAQQALHLARQLQGIVSWAKVGLELYLAAGTSFISRLKDMGYRIFLDLKFMDIPNTVQGAVAQGTAMGVDMLTIHILGGQKMCAAALEGRAQALTTGQRPPLLFGVTLLTSLGPQDLIWEPHGTPEKLQQFTLSLAQNALHWNLDGVVCSGAEISDIRQACGTSFGILTPGIRLPHADKGDQCRISTPAHSIRAGSNFLVVGRPITRAENPVNVAHDYLQAMNQAFAEDI